MRTLALASLFLVTLVGVAHADPTLRCEVVEIDATHTDHASMDPDLKEFAFALKKGPFAQYNTFKKLARIGKDLEVLKPARYDMTKGAVELMVREIEKNRVTLQIDLDDDQGTRYVDAKQSVDLGKFLLYARTVSDTESIITAVGCK